MKTSKERSKFFRELEEDLDKLFPKHECQERGQAIVLVAMANLFYEKHSRAKVEELLKHCQKFEWDDGTVCYPDCAQELRAKLTERGKG